MNLKNGKNGLMKILILFQKIDLIKICGHYILSTPQFLSEYKIKFPNIDNQIKFNIKTN
jgi:hypothetical protein